MRLFIDTDVLLDVFLNREPHYKMSAGVLDWSENHPREAAVSWHGLANLHGNRLSVPLNWIPSWSGSLATVMEELIAIRQGQRG